MLTVTDAAGECLAEILASSPEGVVIRFSSESGSVVPRIDRPQPEDATFEHDNRTVLVLDQEASSVFGDKMLDVRDTHLTLV